MKQVPALKMIAEHGGGQLTTVTAKKLLLQAGLIRTPKNANNILFSVIQRSGLFERVEPGVYRLIAAKPTRPERAVDIPTLY
jgi:predicted transcriptional regulator of viral defense system